MSPTWYSADQPALPPITLIGWGRVGWRATALLGLILAGLALTLILRVVEGPRFGLRRPLTPWITQAVCKAALRIIGITYAVQGQPLAGPGAVVSNHASWLDIFALNAGQRVYFVAKSEVAGWPGIGALARVTGAVFIQRDRTQAKAQIATFRARLAAGQRLLFFPEGTSTDGLRVLPFKPTLFAAFLDTGLRPDLCIQPVSVRYSAPSGADPRFYGWWGDMAFGPHLLAVLAARRQGRVTVVYHDALQVSAFSDRKALAQAAEVLVRTGVVMPSRPAAPAAP